jgi:hypothetical protein
MEGCISGYVAFHATPQMGQRSSKMVQLFFAEAFKAWVADAHERRDQCQKKKYLN